jgi:hypothetical protein
VNKIEEIPHNRHSSRFNPQCIRHRRLQLNKHHVALAITHSRFHINNKPNRFPNYKFNTEPD